MVGYLCLVLGVLLGVIVLFFLVDSYLKNSKKKETAKPAKEVPPPDATKNAQPEVKPATQPAKVAQIYNSNLADELDDILKQNTQDDQTRIQIGKHMHKKSNIAQYLESKNYRTFEFHEVEAGSGEAADDGHKMTLTKDDYKKIVALSNIDTKK